MVKALDLGVIKREKIAIEPYEMRGGETTPLFFARPRTTHAAGIRDLCTLHKNSNESLYEITT